MMTKYEKLHNNTTNPEVYKKLIGYFSALENDKLNEYHDLQDKRKNYRQKRLKKI